MKLYLNGDYRGLYLNVEHIDMSLSKRFIDDDGGNLYKASWGADLNYWGTNASSYRSVYELKTNEDSNDYTAFILFLDSLNNISDSDFPCYMERNFEVNHYLKTLATEILIGHWDGYAFNKNNFYLYRQPSIGKFVFIEYDLTTHLVSTGLGSIGPIETSTIGTKVTAHSLSACSMFLITRTSLMPI